MGKVGGSSDLKTLPTTTPLLGGGGGGGGGEKRAKQGGETNAKETTMSEIQNLYAGEPVSLSFWHRDWCGDAFTEQAARIKAGKAASWKLWDEVTTALCQQLGMRSTRRAMASTVLNTRSQWQCGLSRFDHPTTHTFRTAHNKLRRALIVHNYGEAPDIAPHEPYRVIRLPMSIYSPEHCTAYLIVQTDGRPDLGRKEAMGCFHSGN